MHRRYLHEDLPYPKSPKRLPSVLSQDEVAPDRLRKQSARLHDADDVVCDRGAASGTLPFEVEDIDSHRMIVHIRQGKGNRDRDVPLTPKLLETLREYWRWMKPKTYLFPDMVKNWRADKPLTPKCVWLAIQNAARRAGIKKRVSASKKMRQNRTALAASRHNPLCDVVVRKTPQMAAQYLRHAFDSLIFSPRSFVNPRSVTTATGMEEFDRPAKTLLDRRWLDLCRQA